MRIGTREIGPGHPPYIVAEMSCSHSGSLDSALALVRAAKDAGADAVKFQALQADRITLPRYEPLSASYGLDRERHFTIQDGPWKGRHLYDLYKEAETPIEWWEPIMKEAERVGITCFPSVFDIESIPYLEALGCPAYKVSSFELPDTVLIQALAATGKPLIMSTGMANGAEISGAIKAAYGSEFALLHCVSAYPARTWDSNLGRIQHMRRVYGCPVGLSNHCTGAYAILPAVATAVGARIIEQHLMRPRCAYEHQKVGLPLDADFSLEPNEFEAMVCAVKTAWDCLHEPNPHEAAPDKAHVPLRRSLFAVEDIAEGEIFTKDNVRSIRPGHGLSPSLLPQVLGRRASVAIERGTPLTMELLMKTEAA